MLFHYNVHGEKNSILSWAALCVEVVPSPHVCVGFLQGLWSPSTPQRGDRERNRRVFTAPSGWVRKRHSEGLQHPAQSWERRAETELSYTCFHSSLLNACLAHIGFQCSILEQL